MKKDSTSRYDLHIHSNRSDGSDDWKTILQKAEEAGLAGISITDHDHCDVYAEIENPKEYFSGRLITGIEMSAYSNGIVIEMLGYGIDPVKMTQSLRGLYKPLEEINLIELERVYETFARAGIRFPEGVVGAYDPKKHYYATVYLHDELKKFPENRRFIEDDESWERENIFYRRYTSNPQSPLFVDHIGLFPSAAQVAGLIHSCGGRAFVPHIYQYDEYSDMLLKELLECEIDGIECFYPSFTQEQTEYLLGLCRTRGLKISGGSDYHGANRPKTRIGNVTVEAGLFE